jgi:hypothetical protein
LPLSSAFARVALAMLLALLVCLVIYLAISVPDRWFPSVAPRAFTAPELSLARGTGRLVGDELHVTAADPAGVTLISLVLDLRASDYRTIAWIAADLPDNATVRLVWRSDNAPDKLNAIDVPVEAGRTLPVIVAENPAWIGRITGMALAIQTPLLQPIQIRGVIAKPMGAVEILGDRLGEWFAFEGWAGTSINTITGGADFQDLPLPVLLALAVALAGATVVLIERRRPGIFGAPVPMALAALFLIAWLILDTRWTANLVRQEWYTAQTYAGKDLREKHLAGDDGQLFAFVEKALQVLPPRPVRIFVAADVNYFRGRAAYYLYPHSVFFDARSSELRWVDYMRPGDWLLIYHQPEIQFDISRQLLRWPTGSTTSAELKLIGPDGVLFRLR